MYLFNNAASFEHLKQFHKIKKRLHANSQDCLIALIANSPDVCLCGMLDRIKDYTLIKLIKLMSC